MENNSKNYNKIKKCDNKKTKKQIPHNSNLNNLKSNKYFTINNDDNSMKKALIKYREKININNNPNNKTHQSNISTSDYSQIYPGKSKLNKNYSFKLDKNILNYAEPRAKVKQFHKIQPKIIDSFIVDNDNIKTFYETEDNNEIINNKIINVNNSINLNQNNQNNNKKHKPEKISINLKDLDSSNNNKDNESKDKIVNNGLEMDPKSMANKDKNGNENLNNENINNEKKYIETEIDNKNNINNINIYLLFRM